MHTVDLHAETLRSDLLTSKPYQFTFVPRYTTDKSVNAYHRYRRNNTTDGPTHRPYVLCVEAQTDDMEKICLQHTTQCQWCQKAKRSCWKKM